jgi:hypothetical protein
MNKYYSSNKLEKIPKSVLGHNSAYRIKENQNTVSFLKPKVQHPKVD